MSVHVRELLAREGRVFVKDPRGPREGYRHAPNAVRNCGVCGDEIILHGRIGWLHCSDLEVSGLDGEHEAVPAR